MPDNQPFVSPLNPPGFFPLDDHSVLALEGPEAIAFAHAAASFSGRNFTRSVKAAHATDAASKRATAKLETARFYYDRILPRTRMHLAALQSGADNLMRLDADLFD